jgi:hypothetical protein
MMCSCGHSYGKHDRKALDWPIIADPAACTFYACHCERFTEVSDGAR